MAYAAVIDDRKTDVMVTVYRQLHNFGKNPRLEVFYPLENV